MPESHTSPRPQSRWLLLVHQLPVRPSRLRVMVWRRLQEVGAVPLKNSLYVLPNTPEAREDFEWIKQEILALKGQASIFAADCLEEQASEQILHNFLAVRQKDYEKLRSDAAALLAKVPRTAANGATRRRLARQQRGLIQRWERIVTIDFFGAPGRDEAAAALQNLEHKLMGGQSGDNGSDVLPEKLQAREYRGRQWVTRPRPKIDRLASAWLIRRFIDARARFLFAKDPERKASAIPFDTFGAEFSHHGNRCTFETLALRFCIQDPGVQWLGQVVHAVDLKDERYPHPEARVVGRLIEGLLEVYPKDEDLLERGIELMEALYRSAPEPAVVRQRKKATQAARRR